MTDLACAACAAPEDAILVNDRSAYACSKGHHHEGVERLPRAIVSRTKTGDVCIVLDEHRQVGPAELQSNRLGDIHSVPSREVRRTRDGRSFPVDRKSTRLNSSHVAISYAVFC